MKNNLIKLGYTLAYYGSWYVCILQAAKGNGFIGPLIIGLLMLIHLFLSKNITKQLIFLTVMALIGFIIDSLYLRLGLIFYKALNTEHPYLAPVWIISLWVLFAAVLTKTTDWLEGRWILMIVCGSIGGPLSYSAAIKVGAGHFLVSDFVGYTIIGMMWAIIFPVSFALWNYINATEIGKKTT